MPGRKKRIVRRDARHFASTRCNVVSCGQSLPSLCVVSLVLSLHAGTARGVPEPSMARLRKEEGEAERSEATAIYCGCWENASSCRPATSGKR